MIGVVSMEIGQMMNSNDTATQIAHNLYGEEFRKYFIEQESNSLSQMSEVMRKDIDDIVQHDPVFKYEQIRCLGDIICNDAFETRNQAVDVHSKFETASVDLQVALRLGGELFRKALNKRIADPTSLEGRIQKMTKMQNWLEHRAYRKLKTMVKKGLSLDDMKDTYGQEVVDAFKVAHEADIQMREFDTLFVELNNTAIAYDDLRKRFIGENKYKLQRADKIITHYRVYTNKRMDVINKRMNRSKLIGLISERTEPTRQKVTKKLGEIRAARDCSAAVQYRSTFAPLPSMQPNQPKRP